MVIKTLRQILACFFSAVLLSSCINWGDMSLQHAVKPEDAKEYEPGGALFYFSVYTDPNSTVNGLVIMFRNAPDLSVPVNGGIEGFTLDIPTNCGGISRIGVNYSGYGGTKQFWLRDSAYRFAFSTSNVNYFGRFVLENNMTYDPSFSFRISNVIQKDRVRFSENYSGLTNNRKFAFVELVKDTNR